jgi:hypothetical protein
MTTHRFPAWLFLLFVAGLAASTPAHAQDTSTQLPLQLTAIVGPSGTRIKAEDLNRGINLLDCENPASSWVEFTLLPGSQSVTAVDVWVGIGNETCQTSNSRTPPTQTCRRITYMQIGTAVGSAPDPGTSTIAIGLDAIPSDETFPFCTSTSPSTLNFFFVAELENFTGESSSLAADDWVTISVGVDAGPPDPPAVKSTEYGGDRQVTVEWERVSVGTETITYKVYIENDGCDPNAASGALVPGERPPLDLPAGIIVKEAGQDTASYSISITEIGLELGESATVYVTSMDMARNESVLSEPICVTRVPTAGFCAAWEASEGTECPSSCSTLATSASSVAWLSALLALLALITRRRRSAR